MADYIRTHPYDRATTLYASSVVRADDDFYVRLAAVECLGASCAAGQNHCQEIAPKGTDAYYACMNISGHNFSATPDQIIAVSDATQFICLLRRVPTGIIPSRAL